MAVSAEQQPQFRLGTERDDGQTHAWHLEIDPWVTGHANRAVVSDQDMVTRDVDDGWFFLVYLIPSVRRRFHLWAWIF